MGRSYRHNRFCLARILHLSEALGLSRRQVAYYASGEHEVPRTVLLACKGWEAEQRAAA
jgi:hypothetical protein